MIEVHIILNILSTYNYWKHIFIKYLNFVFCMRISTSCLKLCAECVVQQWMEDTNNNEQKNDENWLKVFNFMTVVQRK